MSTQTQAHTHTLANTGVNPGILAMRAANACRALGLAPRDAGTPKPAKAPKPPRVSAHKPAPKAKGADAPDADEPTATYRVCVLVSAGEGVQTHVWCECVAAGPRRAGKQARAQALAAGHSPVGVCATLRDDCPAAIWAVAV